MDKPSSIYWVGDVVACRFYAALVKGKVNLFWQEPGLFSSKTDYIVEFPPTGYKMFIEQDLSLVSRPKKK